MCLQAAAIILSILGGISELVGLSMVIRQIGSDRDRARSLLSEERKHYPPDRSYPNRVIAPSIRNRSWGEVRSGKAEEAIARSLTEIVNAMVDMRKALDAQTDNLETKLLAEIDRGDEDLRSGFREILSGDLRERWAGVIALGLGIVLSASGSVLSSLS